MADTINPAAILALTQHMPSLDAYNPGDSVTLTFSARFSSRDDHYSSVPAEGGGYNTRQAVTYRFELEDLTVS